MWRKRAWRTGAARVIFVAAVASASILVVLVAQQPAALAQDSHGHEIQDQARLDAWLTARGQTPSAASSGAADVSDLFAASFGAARPLAQASTDPAVVGSWSPVMSWPLVDVHMALLPSGQVLMFDARDGASSTSARVWDPIGRGFVGVPNLLSDVFCTGLAQLPDGRLLTVGGHGITDGTGIQDTDVFDPATSTWSRMAKMSVARWHPIALPLSDGRVLALGGEIEGVNFANIPEIYNPADNT